MNWDYKIQEKRTDDDSPEAKKRSPQGTQRMEVGK